MSEQGVVEIVILGDHLSRVIQYFYTIEKLGDVQNRDFVVVVVVVEPTMNIPEEWGRKPSHESAQR